MGGLDQAIADEILAHQLDLYRLESGTRAQALGILDRMQRELVAKLSHDMTALNKQRTSTLLKEVAAVIDNYYTKAQGELDLTVHGVAHVQASHVANTLNSVFQANIDVALPTDTYLARLAGGSLIQGAPISDWWSRLSMDTAFKVSGEIRQGLAQSETNSQIIARVIGKEGVPGVLDISRRSASALVQTAVQSVANDARLETFRINGDVITKLRWVTALDSRVCDLCLARADLSWSNDADHTPIDNKMAFRNPPIHWNDRCVLVPVTKTFKEMGLDIAEPPRSTRASSDGQVSGDTTFADFLDRKGKSFQDEVLGPGRADMWRRGDITLQDLVSGDGRPLTLAQLRKKYQ